MVKSKFKLYSSMIGLLIFGASNTLVGKLMSRTQSIGHTFAHPYFLTATMFIGEFFCLIFFCLYAKVFKKASLKFNTPTQPKPGPKTCREKMGIFVFAIPSFLDLCTACLLYTGLILIAPSVYQMMKGFLVIVVSIYSIVFLKLKLFRHQVVGVVLILIGVIIVGSISITNVAPSAKNLGLGIVLLIIAQLFAGGNFVTEQLYLKDIKVHPLQVVGIEGLAGMVYFLVLLPLLNLIPCEHPDLFNGGSVENSIEALRQIENSLVIFLCVLGFMFGITFYYFTGVTVTKKAGALARSTVETCRALIIWIISILIGWEIFIPPQLVGFCFIVAGTAINNEVLKISYFGLKKSIEDRREYMEIRKVSKHNNETSDNDAIQGLHRNGNYPGIACGAFQSRVSVEIK